MVLCWLISKKADELKSNEQEHRTHIDIDSLRRIGVVHHFINVNDYKTDLKKYADKYEFKNMDEVVINPKSDDYEAMSKHFFTEHLHTDREMRLILEGFCYFDVRNENDEWIRILCEAGDLIILPSGIYHRFSLTEKNCNTRAIRLFSNGICWTPYNRNSLTEELPERKYYVSSLSD